MAKLIELKGISKSYDGEKVIDSMNLYIRDGEFITFLGPSGCGKTTTLRIIGGFETADEGQLYFDGVEIHDLSKRQSLIDAGYITADTPYISDSDAHQLELIGDRECEMDESHPLYSFILE